MENFFTFLYKYSILHILQGVIHIFIMHSIQEKLLKILNSQPLQGQTLRQIGELIGETSPQKIKHHLEQLQERGLIQIDKTKKQIKRVTGDMLTGSSFISVPIIGGANCGPATIFANENIEGYLKLSPSLLKKHNRIFAIRAHGISMNRAQIAGKTIEDGDYLIIDSSDTTPTDGDVILSVIDDMANIKKYVWDEENNQVVLVSQSSRDIPPIYIHADDSFFINGKVIQVIKKPKV